MKKDSFILIRKKTDRLRLSLRRDGTPIVYAPKRIPISKIESFVGENLPKLLQNAQNSESSKISAVLGNLNTPTLMLFGKRYPIVKANGAFFSFNGKEFRVSDAFETAQILSAYREFLRLRSQESLPKIVRSYADEYDLTYNNITIKNIYSRFGSCSGKKNLNFTLALSAFDEKFISFIATHELSHLVHMNHSAEFHAFHRSIFPEADSISTEMKKEYSRFLTALCTL